ncbi:NADPH-dependent FMN reductase [Kiloniella antarctica]|uniref:NADPH-dependent FMN reductase n=1 Tax=Kiloniella antarctica TaxID=1550907 RepID=A0ABW5BR82_9PROT
MKILAISGSTRQASTNTAMLRSIASVAPSDVQINVFQGISELPIFSPDLEAIALPRTVQNFANLVHESDGVIIASPEYVKSIPGGLKNVIDWLVSREEIVTKPISLVHASHRGDDMLQQLRLVLSTVSELFSKDIFLRFNLLNQTPCEILDFLELPQHRLAIDEYLQIFSEYCRK